MLTDTRRKGNDTNPKKNIGVAVRVRPMSQNEYAEKAKISVTVNESKSTLSVNERGVIKEFGPFDKVYTADSRQLDVYNDLVNPSVKNVLAGYNCTIFAYGQTSTGKTFTMEGDQNLIGGHSWDVDSQIGIIPRALQHIFAELKTQDSEEFSVRISYVELYNEELYDLLGKSDLGNAKLRIFEDPAHKGSVVISCLEEVLVTDEKKAYDLLRKGAEKRRTAATLLNLNSSRSHTIFAITVVIRETTRAGEEFIKQGKLNMIDLAGSENIGRSGSIEKRAREAGSINQSLLTLGRVINALIAGASHVPYRESKLTRILQDSLGGRTITTIIATLSPASTCVEETIGTLEYASRAKGIKNHPERNKKFSLKVLFKAYNEQMKRIVKDLSAARDENGFFVDRQSYKDMNARLMQQKECIESLTDQVQTTHTRMQTLLGNAEFMVEQYARLYERHKRIEKKYKSQRSAHVERKMKIAEYESKLADRERVIEKLQEAANKSGQQSYQLKLYSVKLVDSCASCLTDLSKLMGNIHAMEKVNEENERLYTEYKKDCKERNGRINHRLRIWSVSTNVDLQKLLKYFEKIQQNFGTDSLQSKEDSQSLHRLLKATFTMQEEAPKFFIAYQKPFLQMYLI